MVAEAPAMHPAPISSLLPFCVIGCLMACAVNAPRPSPSSSLENLPGQQSPVLEVQRSAAFSGEPGSIAVFLNSPDQIFTQVLEDYFFLRLRKAGFAPVERTKLEDAVLSEMKRAVEPASQQTEDTAPVRTLGSAEIAQSVGARYLLMGTFLTGRRQYLSSPVVPTTTEQIVVMNAVTRLIDTETKSNLLMAWAEFPEGLTPSETVEHVVEVLTSK